MPSTTPLPPTDLCNLAAVESCTGRTLRTYFEGTASQVTLCRQCRSRFGVILVSDAAVDGGDVETMFRDIMQRLALAKTRGVTSV